MDNPTRRRAAACAPGPLPWSRPAGVASMTPNSSLYPLAQLRAGAPGTGVSAARRHGAHRPIVAGLMLSGFRTEACLMGRIAGGPYEAGGAVAGFALLFLAWFWLSLGCLLQALLRLTATLVRGRTWAASLLAGVALGCVL